MAQGKFGTAINCMDGRVQLPVIEYLIKTYNLEYIDSITEPGPVKILAENGAEVDSIKRRVNISVEAHGSKIIAVIAHYDCAGNPVPKETQIEQLKFALKTVGTWNYNVPCIGLWVDENWQVEHVKFN